LHQVQAPAAAAVVVLLLLLLLPLALPLLLRPLQLQPLQLPLLLLPQPPQQHWPPPQRLPLLHLLLPLPRVLLLGLPPLPLGCHLKGPCYAQTLSSEPQTASRPAGGAPPFLQPPARSTGQIKAIV
jgi:hypothetical protein